MTFDKYFSNYSEESATQIPTPLKISDLWAFRCSTIHAGAFDTGRLAIVKCHLLNLLS